MISRAWFSEDGEGVADLEREIGVGAEELVNGAGGAGELGVVIIVDDDDSLRREAGEDEAEADFNRLVEVAVAEGKGDLGGEVRRGEVAEPSFFDNNVRGGYWSCVGLIC